VSLDTQFADDLALNSVGEIISVLAKISINWPNGMVSIFHNVDVNQRMTITAP
jgi:hypothetical protein